MSQKGYKDSILSDKTSYIIHEAYNTARTNLMFLLSTKGYKSIIVSSHSPAEGKTTTCINLAKTFAKTGKKVLIIDADMRAPEVHTVFNLPKSPGLSDILAGFSDWNCIKESDEENLSVMPAGITPPNTAELIASDKFFDMINTLSQKYDYIFIDTPPASLFPDALSISNKMCGVIIVAQYYTTKKEMIKRLIEKFSKVNANLLGVVLNNYGYEKYLEQIGGNKGKYYSKYGYGRR